ncbi:MAG TPA: hypothetical protein VNO31_02775 [Umezawaea sp.]|nr:hypothetical protein [Umezawaea sp.]
MTALTSAVVLVGALGALNLILTFGVIRRLRGDAGTLTQPSGIQPPMAPVGTSVPANGLDWHGETLVGFFMPGCGPCDEQLPGFLEHAQRWDRSVAVVFDPSGEGAEYIRKLEPAAHVVVEGDSEDSLQKDFQVKGFPSFCVVRDGVVVSVSGRAADLSEPAVRTLA